MYVIFFAGYFSDIHLKGDELQKLNYGQVQKNCRSCSETHYYIIVFEASFSGHGCIVRNLGI